MNEEIETIFITEGEAGDRLDKILAKRFDKVGSRTYFQFLIDEHKVLLNGSPAKKRERLKQNDEVEIEFVLTPELDLSPQDIPLNIIYEDQDIIIINKPAGMVVHPACGHWSGTFVNALLFHCQQVQELIREKKILRPGIVHRIDKDTSGLLVAAKTATAQQRLIDMFAGRQVHKEYLAICFGNPGNREIQAPIGRHPTKRQMMAVLDSGREALTTCKTLAFDGRISLVHLVIATGRTHQIRVHMKHIGTPVLGDSLYGNQQINKKYNLERQMLHAHVLRFCHPISKTPLEFCAEPPQDMQQFIRKF